RGAGGDRHRGGRGVLADGRRRAARARTAGVGDRRDGRRHGAPDRRVAAAHARRRRAGPAQPRRLVAAPRARGGDRPRRPERLQPEGYALTERLCVYPQYIAPEWMAQGVLDVIKTEFWSFIPRRGSGRREERPIRRDLVPAAIAKARDGLWLEPDELTALFAEDRPEAIE